MRICRVIFYYFVRTLTSAFGLAVINIIYLGAGAWIFWLIESPNEQSRSVDLQTQRKTAVDAFYKAVDKKAPAAPNKEKELAGINKALSEFEVHLAAFYRKRTIIGTNTAINASAALWTEWGAVIYAYSVVTTIGWGNIVPGTLFGRMATIFYGFVGIPLVFTLSSEVGSFTGKMIRLFSHLVRRLTCATNQNAHDKSLNRAVYKTNDAAGDTTIRLETTAALDSGYNHIPHDDGPPFPPGSTFIAQTKHMQSYPMKTDFQLDEDIGAGDDFIANKNSNYLKSVASTMDFLLEISRDPHLWRDKDGKGEIPEQEKGLSFKKTGHGDLAVILEKPRYRLSTLKDAELLSKQLDRLPLEDFCRIMTFVGFDFEQEIIQRSVSEDEDLNRGSIFENTKRGGRRPKRRGREKKRERSKYRERLSDKDKMRKIFESTDVNGKLKKRKSNHPWNGLNDANVGAKERFEHTYTSQEENTEARKNTIDSTFSDESHMESENRMRTGLQCEERSLNDENALPENKTKGYLQPSSHFLGGGESGFQLIEENETRKSGHKNCLLDNICSVGIPLGGGDHLETGEETNISNIIIHRELCLGQSSRIPVSDENLGINSKYMHNSIQTGSISRCITNRQTATKHPFLIEDIESLRGKGRFSSVSCPALTACLPFDSFTEPVRAAIVETAAAKPYSLIPEECNDPPGSILRQINNTPGTSTDKSIDNNCIIDQAFQHTHNTITSSSTMGTSKRSFNFKHNDLNEMMVMLDDPKQSIGLQGKDYIETETNIRRSLNIKHRSAILDQTVESLNSFQEGLVILQKPASTLRKENTHSFELAQNSSGSQISGDTYTVRCEDVKGSFSFRSCDSRKDDNSLKSESESFRFHGSTNAPCQIPKLKEGGKLLSSKNMFRVMHRQTKMAAESANDGIEESKNIKEMKMESAYIQSPLRPISDTESKTPSMPEYRPASLNETEANIKEISNTRDHNPLIEETIDQFLSVADAIEIKALSAQIKRYGDSKVTNRSSHFSEIETSSKPMRSFGLGLSAEAVPSRVHGIESADFQLEDPVHHPRRLTKCQRWVEQNYPFICEKERQRAERGRNHPVKMSSMPQHPEICGKDSPYQQLNSLSRTHKTGTVLDKHEPRENRKLYRTDRRAYTVRWVERHNALVNPGQDFQPRYLKKSKVFSNEYPKHSAKRVGQMHRDLFDNIHNTAENSLEISHPTCSSTFTGRRMHNNTKDFFLINSVYKTKHLDKNVNKSKKDKTEKDKSGGNKKSKGKKKDKSGKRGEKEDRRRSRNKDKLKQKGESDKGSTKDRKKRGSKRGEKSQGIDAPKGEKRRDARGDKKRDRSASSRSRRKGGHRDRAKRGKSGSAGSGASTGRRRRRRDRSRR
ncbi:hypothetical protein EGW08_003090, partial [Elysia chlorotica]